VRYFCFSVIDPNRLQFRTVRLVGLLPTGRNKSRCSTASRNQAGPKKLIRRITKQSSRRGKSCSGLVAVPARLVASVMRLDISAICFLLAGCATPQVERNSAQICSTEMREGWTQIDVPSERAELMLVPTVGGKNIPAQEHLTLSNKHSREVWFRNIDGRLKACAYTTARNTCNGGTLHTVEFRHAAVWTAGAPLEEICVTAD
jgi:hypothetical protein